MTALQETKIEVSADHPTILDRWPEETITFMGWTVLSVAALQSRNHQISNESDDLTLVYFGVDQPTLTINGLTALFNKYSAKALAAILIQEPGFRPSSEVIEDIAQTFNYATNTAQVVLSRGIQPIRGWQPDQNGSLIEQKLGFVKLRDGLIFLPSDEVAQEMIYLPPSRKKLVSKKSKALGDKVMFSELPQSGQLYFTWWQNHIPKPPENSSDIYTDASSCSKPNPFNYNQPKLDLNFFASDEENNDSATKIFRTTDEFIQVAMTAAFDYFFYGGDIPLVSDTKTYEAFQRAIQELGGYESTEFSGPVAKLYLGTSEARLTTVVRRRIKALGESIHTERPREVNMRTVTPSEDLSNASKEWMRDGACHGLEPDIFHLDEDAKDDSPDVLVAKEICQRCTIQGVCLEYAIATHQNNGVWGGATARERRNLIRERRRQAAKKSKKTLG